MNGAELACGSILHVEQASSNKKTNHSTKRDPEEKRELLPTVHVPGRVDDPKNQLVHDETLSDDDVVLPNDHEQKSENTVKEKGVDEELDEFFDSL